MRVDSAALGCSRVHLAVVSMLQGMCAPTEVVCEGVVSPHAHVHEFVGLSDVSVTVAVRTQVCECVCVSDCALGRDFCSVCVFVHACVGGGWCPGLHSGTNGLLSPSLFPVRGHVSAP